MPVFLNWLLRLAPTNPICMRLVQGGSRRGRHLFIRGCYLGVMIVVLMVVMILSGNAASLRDLARAGASTFQTISYLQVGLICMLTPVFMAGAIAQEANPDTWNILLTTPLNSLQIVLGNLLGRLFFVLALLFSTLPLFAVTQYFGGVPGESIFVSYAIAACSALVVAAIAVTLSVTRTAGRRAVFIFYIAVVLYLFVTYSLDMQLRERASLVTPEKLTTFFTPLNPFLALQVLLESNSYVPHDLTGTDAGWLKRMWFGRPIAAFCWVCVCISLGLVAYSTIGLRIIGTRAGFVPWYRRMFRLGARGADQRPARHVSHNPIAWRESVARGNTLTAIVGRWGFLALGIAVAFVLVALYHSQFWSGAQLRLALMTAVAAEIVIVVLVALNTSATAVSREREDGTLDLILTTPIQPGAYLAGKLRGLIQFLLPMLLVPTLTMIIIAIYVLMGGFGRSGGVMVNSLNPGGGGTIAVPVMLPVGALALPLTLGPFAAFCVMIGLHWSIKSKGTITSVIWAVGVVLVIAGILSLCAMAMADNFGTGAALLAAFSPIYLLRTIVSPVEAVPDAASHSISALSVTLVVGSIIAAAVYVAIVIGMHANMKRTFMMTVRRLAGAS